ncbi:MAG: right-handed parallel beta-helix repeat-containing protein, partial [Patescibacteria group bacterium]
MTSRTKFLKFLNPKLLRQASQFGTPPPRIFKICSLHHFLIVAAVFLVPFHVNAATFVNEHITADTTWTLAGSPYVVENLWLQVYPGATLTIEPGVIVKFGESSYIHVYGKLNAVGTPGNKIYFTALRDDSIGGDTNGDGDATQPTAYNNWSVFLRENSGPHLIKNADAQYSNNPFWVHRSTADFENINIRDALAAGIAGVESNISIKNLRGTASSNTISGEGGTFDISNSEIFSSRPNSVGLRFSTNAEVLISSTTVRDFIDGIGLGLFGAHATATNSVFKNNGQGLKVDDASGSTSLTINQSFISDNASYGIYSLAASPVDARKSR